MKFEIELNHPEDELDGPSLEDAITITIEDYIRDKGHLSNYSPAEWDLTVREVNGTDGR